MAAPPRFCKASSLVWWGFFSCRSKWWRARFYLWRAPCECRAGIQESQANKRHPAPLLWRTWLPCRHLTWQRRAGSRAAGTRGTDVQPDVWTRPGAEEPPDARRRSSSSPGEAGLQFLGTSAKGSAAVSRQTGGRRLQRSVILPPKSPLRFQPQIILKIQRWMLLCLISGDCDFCPFSFSTNQWWWVIKRSALQQRVEPGGDWCAYWPGIICFLLLWFCSFCSLSALWAVFRASHASPASDGRTLWCMRCQPLLTSVPPSSKRTHQSCSDTRRLTSGPQQELWCHQCPAMKPGWWVGSKRAPRWSSTTPMVTLGCEYVDMLTLCAQSLCDFVFGSSHHFLFQSLHQDHDPAARTASKTYSTCLSTAAGPAGSYQSCVRVGSRPSATQMASATPGTATPQRQSPWPARLPNRLAWRSAWTTTSTPVWPGLCPSATATRPCWPTSPGTRASSPGWWQWTPSPRWDKSTRKTGDHLFVKSNSQFSFPESC